MNLKTQLLSQHSKANTMLIAKWIGRRRLRFDKLMQLFLSDEVVVVQRAAWLISEVGCEYPHLLRPYLDELIASLEAPLHQAVQRNVLKTFAETQISMTEDQQGLLLNTCFDFLINPQTPVATQVHAMQYIVNQLPLYPELAIELKEIITANMEHASAAYIARGKRILKKIE